jgi:hypothetical protein
MRFVPKTETEIQAERDAALGVWPKGIYDFEIVHAEDKISAKGNEMIELSVHVFNADGVHKTVRDFLLESMAHKLRHAAEACGLLVDYERGTIVAEKMIGKTGRCRLDIEKDKAGQFPDKNRIVDYEKPRVALGARSAPPPVRQPTPAGDIDDEIPF